jgi:hypothetical protein
MDTATLERNESEAVTEIEQPGTVDETSELAADAIPETETAAAIDVPRETQPSETLTVEEQFQRDYDKWVQEHGTHEDPTGEIKEVLVPRQPHRETEIEQPEPEAETLPEVSSTNKASFFTQENISKFLTVALFLTIIAFSLHTLYGIFNKPKQTNP